MIFRPSELQGYCSQDIEKDMRLVPRFLSSLWFVRAVTIEPPRVPCNLWRPPPLQKHVALPLRSRLLCTIVLFAALTAAGAFATPTAAAAGQAKYAISALFSSSLSVHPATMACLWTGTWSTDYGPMSLTQNGSEVTGTYTHDSGRINGTVTGAVLAGRWSEAPSYAEPYDAGRLSFTMAADFNSFAGLWSYGTAAPSSGWNGTRTSDGGTPAPAPVTEPVGPAGAEIAVGGGTAQDGGVTVSVPGGTFSSTVQITVSVANNAPTGVSTSGAALLPKTIEVTTDTGAVLASTVEIRVNLTPTELAGRDANTIKGGVVVGATVDPELEGPLVRD